MKTIKVVLTMVIAACCSSVIAQDKESFDDCSRKVHSTAKMRVSQGVIEGLVKHKALPDASDLRSIKDADVKVKIVIDESGAVACAEGVEGDPVLYPRSVGAARNWKFQPYLLNGKPVVLESSFGFRYDKGKVRATFSHP
ncbi:MAG: energy transducer TonB [Candidatus Angelobacter sp.]